MILCKKYFVILFYLNQRALGHLHEFFYKSYSAMLTFNKCLSYFLTVSLENHFIEISSKLVKVVESG